MTTAIVWFRQDLRLSDNPALLAASEEYDQVIPVYIDDTQATSQLGEASRVWLHHSLSILRAELEAQGSSLLLFQNDSTAVIEHLCKTLEIDAVLWNRCYDPESIERDTKLKASLKSEAIYANSYNASLLYEPWQVLKKDGTPYRVFTPYWKEVSRIGLTLPPSPAPKSIPPLPDISDVTHISLEDLSLIADKPWPSEMLSHWKIGESAAQQSLTHYLDHSGPEDYQKTRDFPGTPGTSRMSPHLISAA